MQLSTRQMELVKGAAAVLVTHLQLTPDEAVRIIGSGLFKELELRNVSMETIDISSRAERAAFVRAAVKHVHETLRARREWPSAKLDKAIESFMQILFESWEAEG